MGFFDVMCMVSTNENSVHVSGCIVSLNAYTHT